MSDPTQCLIEAAERLRDRAARLHFGAPVTHIYNPLEYAWSAHRRYVERFGSGGASILLLGMNPGPFGMVQTGVPFGDVEMVREWLGLEARVGRPSREHAKRPVRGLACGRREVSGQRMWGWARTAYGSPQRFFTHFFVWNYCPLAFMEASGRNRTPDKLSRTEREPLYRVCDEALRRVVEGLRPTHVIGIGRFAFERARALGDIGVTLANPGSGRSRVY